LGLGASLGCWQALRAANERERPLWSTFLLLVLAGALLGSRAWFVLQLSFTSTQAVPFFSFWQGGLSWPGAVLGGLAVWGALSLMWRMPPGLTADRLLPLLVLLPAAAWLGCWQAGCAYGRELPAGSFWGLGMRDEAGAYSERFPLQFLAVLLVLALVITLLVLQRRHLFLPGQLAATFGTGLGLDLLLVAFLRADPQPRWQGWPVDAWAALALAVACAAAWFAAGRAAKPEW
jgi:prolipoprotein diacylglyceryltransferase